MVAVRSAVANWARIIAMLATCCSARAVAVRCSRHQRRAMGRGRAAYRHAPEAI
jgi:hypothetical protein